MRRQRGCSVANDNGGRRLVARQRCNKPRRDQGVFGIGRQSRTRSRKGRDSARSFRAEQRHRKCAAVRGVPSVRRRARHKKLFRRRANGYRACAPTRKRSRPSRNAHSRRGLAHVHIRRARLFLHGRRLDRPRIFAQNGKTVVQSSASNKSYAQGQSPAKRVGQRRNTQSYRQNRRVRRTLCVARIFRQRVGAVDGRPFHRVQHGDRGGREKRHISR